MMAKAKYMPVTDISRHFQTLQPCPSGASLCKLAGAGTEGLEQGFWYCLLEEYQELVLLTRYWKRS